jgi:hypothetical protein
MKRKVVVYVCFKKYAEAIQCFDKAIELLKSTRLEWIQDLNAKKNSALRKLTLRNNKNW